MNEPRATRWNHRIIPASACLEFKFRKFRCVEEGCSEPAAFKCTFWVTWRKPGANVQRRVLYYCDAHGRKWAETHKLEVADATDGG